MPLQYGTPAWDSYWSKLNGDGNLTWGPDAQLTPTGIAQAQAVHDAWVSQLSAHRSGKDSAPLPSKLYSSPLSRSANTLNHTFAGIILAETPKEALGSIAKGQLPGLEHPLVKELFREQYGVHTCDKRSNKAVLHERFPTYFFEKGFTEEDEIWTVRLHFDPWGALSHCSPFDETMITEGRF